MSTSQSVLSLTSTTFFSALPLVSLRQSPWPDPESCCEEHYEYKIFGSRSKKAWGIRGSARNAYDTIRDNIDQCLEARQDELYDGLDLSSIPHAVSCFMVGTKKLRSRPTIVIFSQLPQFCRRLQRAIEETPWWKVFMQTYPAFGGFLFQPWRPRRIAEKSKDMKIAKWKERAPDTNLARKPAETPRFSEYPSESPPRLSVRAPPDTLPARKFDEHNLASPSRSSARYPSDIDFAGDFREYRFGSPAELDATNVLGRQQVFATTNAGSLLGARLYLADTTTEKRFVEKHQATLGNIVFMNGVPFALTVAHTFRTGDQYEQEQAQEVLPTDDEWILDDSEDEDEDEDDLTEDSSLSSSPEGEHTNSENRDDSERSILLGSLFTRSDGGASDKLDWAMIAASNSHVKALVTANPNFSRTAGSYQSKDGTRTAVPFPTRVASLPRSTIEVYTTKNNGRLIKGVLGTSSSLVCLFGSRTYISLETVLLEERVHAGDCGKWIFDKEGNWYGHIVAGHLGSNIAYIAAATRIAAAIKDRYGMPISLGTPDIFATFLGHSPTMYRSYDPTPAKFSQFAHGSSQPKSAPQLSDLLRGFLQPPSEDYEACQRYCMSNPAVWSQDTRPLHGLAARCLYEDKHEFARRCAERLLMMSAVQQMKWTAAQANTYLKWLTKDDNTFQDQLDKLLSRLSQEIQAREGSDINTDADTLGEITVNELEKREKGINGQTKGVGPILGLISGDFEKDNLNASYKLYTGREAENFFIRGRVFAMVWHENAGRSANPNATEVTATLDRPFNRLTVNADGVTVFSHIRRFVIVKAKPRSGYCLAIPINSYEGQGLTNKKMQMAEKQAHSIIYDIRSQPVQMPGEVELDKEPIAVVLEPGEELTQSSRLHFGKMHAIEWNVKVKNIGLIADPKNMGRFRLYFKHEFQKGEDTEAEGEGKGKEKRKGKGKSGY